MLTPEWLIQWGPVLRIGFFLTFFILLAWIETFHTWRGWVIPRLTRWGRHFSLTILSKLLIKACVPVLLIEVAFNNTEKGMGFLNGYDIPFVFKFLLGILAMDLAIYAQHLVMHRLKWLWIFHRVHHIDTELDVSTGIRFHPIEELISIAFKMLVVIGVGVNAWAVLVFEIILNFSSLFTHTNVALNPTLEKKLRWFIVTPDMHRIHHSDMPREHNQNFGFCLSIWDRIFKTYQPHPFLGTKRMVLGIEQYHDSKYQSLLGALLLPFNLKYFRIKRKKKVRLQMSLQDE